MLKGFSQNGNEVGLRRAACFNMGNQHLRRKEST